MSSSSSSSSALVMPLHFILPTDPDHFPLSVSQFAPPPNVEVRAIAVFSNATGVQARFYHRFASWLASQGVATLTFDYRYSGTSFPADTLATLNRSSPDYQDRMYEALLTAPRHDFGLNDTWARRDLASVVRYAFRTWAKVPLTVCGHSLGGHLMLVCDYKTTYAHVDPDGTPRTARLLALNAGNPHYKDFDNDIYNEETDYGFHMAAVLNLESEGVFRASYMGLGFDLPYGPGKEWVRWFNHPHFSLHVEEDRQRAREITKHMQYIYFGFEDDAQIKKRMMEQQSRMLNVQEGKVQTFWINPAAHNPRWPVCGHVDFCVPSKPIPIAADRPGTAEGTEASQDKQAAPENSEGYQAAAAPSGEDATTRTLGRDETIWQVILGYIIQGTVDRSLGEYKLLGPADARDIEKERKLEEEFRRKHRRTGDGARPETGYPGDEGSEQCEVPSPKSRL
ncbi:hypothetical protein V8E36_000273 [Tilletia maclaganii]